MAGLESIDDIVVLLENVRSTTCSATSTVSSGKRE